MIIDCHHHLDERMLGLEDLLKKMDEAGIDKVALMAALNDPLPEPAHILVRLLQFLLRHGATRGAARLMSERFTKDGDLKLPMGQFKVYPDPDNEPVFQAVKKNPKRFCGWIFVNPRGNSKPADVIDRYRRMPGVVGIKAHPFWHRYAPDELLKAAELAMKMDKPLLMHLGFGPNGDFMPLVKAVPGLKLILAHAAFPRHKEIWRMIKANRNICVDLSQTTYVGQKMIRQAVEFLGSKRCLFGTDGPYGSKGADGKFDLGQMKGWIESMFPTERDRRRILCENFADMANLRY